MFRFWTTMDFAPLVIAMLSAFLTTMTMAFTGKRAKIRRLMAVLVVLLTIKFIQACQTSLENRLWKALITTIMWIQCIKTFDDLCLTDTSAQDGVFLVEGVFEGEEISGFERGRDVLSTKIYTKLTWAIGMLWNMRGIHTSWSIKRIPPFSIINPNNVPSRMSFLRGHCRTIVLAYLLLDLFANQPPPDLTMILKNRQHFLFRLSEITIEDFVFRVSVVLGFWLNTMCIVAMIHSLLAVVHIGFRLQNPSLWPPIFGQLSEAYSIRRFWGYVLWW
jgi:hypothetical protein